MPKSRIPFYFDTRLITRKTNKLSLSILLYFLIGISISCSRYEILEPLGTVNLASTVTYDVKFNFCTPPAEEQKLYLKTIIILDHSGSNAENYKMATDGSGAPDVTSGNIIISPMYATDPKGLTRYGTVSTPGTLLNYLSTLAPNDPQDPTRFFSLVDFNSSVKTYPVLSTDPNNLSGSSGFTSDINAFYNYVANDAGAAQGGAPNDASGTSYLSALTAAYNIINSDIQAAKACVALSKTATPTPSCPKPGVVAASSYVIVFMSDGSPITQINGVGMDAGGNTVVTGPISLVKESTTEILAKVAAITDLQVNDKYVAGINLFSIYYYYPGNVDTSGQALLAQMAKVGNGLAYNALSGSNIDYNQFQPPAKTIQYTLSNVLVTNSSALWWNDGNYHNDSDSDGLPDDIETTWGSDPKIASTDGNGISDLVKYRITNAAACTKKNTAGLCIDPITNYRTTLCSGVKYTIVKTKVVFNSSDPNGLNDCEKILLNDAAGIGMPDSNSDNIPDWLEFIHGVPFQNATTPAINTVNQDGYTTFQKIKFSLPVSTPMNTMLNVVPADYNLTAVSSVNSLPCYQLKVSNFPVIGTNDRIRVDVIMKSNLVKDSYLYKVGFKRFNPNNTTLELNDWSDVTEISNKTWSSWP